MPVMGGAIRLLLPAANDGEILLDAGIGLVGRGGGVKVRGPRRRNLAGEPRPRRADSAARAAPPERAGRIAASTPAASPRSSNCLARSGCNSVSATRTAGLCGRSLLHASKIASTASSRPILRMRSSTAASSSAFHVPSSVGGVDSSCFKSAASRAEDGGRRSLDRRRHSASPPRKSAERQSSQHQIADRCAIVRFEFDRRIESPLRRRQLTGQERQQAALDQERRVERLDAIEHTFSVGRAAEQAIRPGEIANDDGAGAGGFERLLEPADGHRLIVFVAGLAARGAEQRRRAADR